MPTQINKNPVIASNTTYSGLYYVFSAYGGYQIEEGLKTITLLPSNQVNQYDITDSLQVMFDVRTFNTAIGIIKDASNQRIISTTFDASNGIFPLNSITLTASQFVSGMAENQIISLGKLKNVYSDFITYVNNYFAIPNGFSNTFTISSQLEINGGIFDSAEFINVIHSQTLNPATGEYIKDLSGSITLNYVNELLTYVCYANTFNNRSPSTSNIRNGFIEGDVIYVPNGITITLSLNLISNQIILNSSGQTGLSQLNTNAVNSYSSSNANNFFTMSTTVTDTNIKRVIKAPLLIQLKNIS